MIRCKDCIWYEPAHVLFEDGTTREFTEEEKPLGVTADVGINVGGRCKYFDYNKACWMGEEDFCSRGQKISYDHDNKFYVDHEGFVTDEDYEERERAYSEGYEAGMVQREFELQQAFKMLCGADYTWDELIAFCRRQ